MNRQFLGTLAVILTLASAHATRGQMPAYPPAAAYPAQAAYYTTSNPGASGVYPAAYSMTPQGGVQLASCPTCGPGGEPGYGVPAYAGSGYSDASYGPGMGCVDGSCGGGWMDASGCADGSCGPAGLGDHLASWLDNCGGYNCGKAHGPYGDGGCCLPRWFDVHAEWLFWQRDYSDSQAFSSRGILGPTVLDANQLDFSEESGFRVTGAYLVGPATALEATYFGTLNWASSAQVTGDGDLFSVFSDFGSDPFNGFPETDFANLHQLGLSSELDNAELNLRHRSVSANCLWHSSLLIGVRYLRLREDLSYRTETNVAAMDYALKVDNDLVGAQIGGDLFLCVTPRFKIGGEIEAGVYGTSSSQRTNVTTTDSPVLHEYLRDNDVAFIGEAGVSGLYRITSRWTFRGGYQVLYVDGVATAVDNFNTASPFSARTALLSNNGNVFYHGANLGFEWTW